MRKRLLILTAAVLLALVLAVPASASKPTKVSGGFIADWGTLTDEEVPVGNRCFVNVWYNASLDGAIAASCAVHEWQVAHGPCDEEIAPGVYEHIYPGKYRETLHVEADCSDATLGGKSGTFQLRGNGEMVPVDPPTPFVFYWREDCVIQSGTGDLANLHGSLTLESLPVQAGTYSGEIHFDPN
jgi:hypothetical protein